jgi:hypothetical protein
MNRVLSLVVALCLALPAALPAQSPTNPQLLQGTQVRLVLMNGLSTSVTRDGDPFTAVVSEPIYWGNQLILPAGAMVHGQVVSVQKPKRFSLFRGPAAMQLAFRAIEIDHREIPVQMSIISIHETSAQPGGKSRKDLRVEEGVLVEAKYDVKRDLTGVGLSTGGGAVVGAIFSHAVRGLTIGLIGGTGYVMARKGKEVELPARTGMLVRMDTTVTLPMISNPSAPYTGGQP